jgi:peptide/nickel transport system permease protein
MLKLAARRLLLSIPLVFAASTVTFLLVALLPGDAARAILGAEGGTETQYEHLRNELGLDQPLWTQYGRWLDGAVRGDLGTSLISQQEVFQQLNSRLAPTLSLIVGAMLVSATIGVSLGVLARRGGRLGRFVDVISLAGLATPAFWLGLMLIVVFAVHMRVFPPTGYVAFTDSPSEWLASLALPVITLSMPATASVAKQTRDAMADALGRGFTRTLRAAGVPERSIVFRHALKNSANRILTVVGLNFIAALGGTVVVESVFSIPGLGGLAVQATAAHDVPLIQGIVVYFTVVVVVVNLLVDVAYGYFDPKVSAA